MTERDWSPKEMRRWLIRKLASTSWVQPRSNETIEELAKKMGVQPDVLIAAKRHLRAQMDRSTEVSGIAPIRMLHDGKRVALGRLSKIHLAMPQEIKAAWDQYMSIGGYTDAVLLRSIIHHGLLRPEQPKWVGKGWPYRGKVYHCDGWMARTRAGGQWPHFTITRVASGAKDAIILRSRAMRTTIRGFVRGLVLDLLNGEIQSFDVITEISQMYDTDRYYTLEGTLEKRALAAQRRRTT